MVYKVPAPLFEQIRAYLATRPYQEVVGAMAALAAMKPEEDTAAVE